MSSTKKTVIIFSGIFLASIIGMAITFGVFVSAAGGIGSLGDINNLGGIFKGQRFEVDESSGLDLAGVSAVKIEATSSDIRIIPSDTAKVELKGTIVSGSKTENYLDVTKQEGTLFIKVKDDTWSMFNLLSVFNDLDLTVYLPAESMLDASVHCTSGNTDIRGMQFGNVELRKTSGNTKIRDCSAESFLYDASSGDTKIESSELGSMKLTCSSGNISVHGTSGSIYAHATSGNIDIAGAGGAVDAGCTSGRINITGTSESIDVECTSGDISIDVAGVMPPITAGITSGNIKIYLPYDAAFDIEAKTTSGNLSSDLDIAVSGSLSRSFIGENISGTCNGGGPLVSIAVTSGNINIIGK
jgi:DUF4097 and DUF4098 domain-containing protein YvlB